MFKTALFASFIGLAGIPAPAQNGTNPTTSGGVALCPETVQGIARLQQYGHRFDSAIELMLAEAAKPHWESDACEQPGARVVVIGLEDPAFTVAARQ